MSVLCISGYLIIYVNIVDKDVLIAMFIVDRWCVSSVIMGII